MTDEEFAEIRETFIESGVAVLELKKQIAEAEDHLIQVSDEYGEAFDEDEQLELAQEGWRRVGIDDESIAAMTEQIQQMRAYFAAQEQAAKDDVLADFTVIGETG